MDKEAIKKILMDIMDEQDAFNHKLVKVYDPINPESTIKNHIIEAYNAGYEDAKCNHINDAEQYYLNKYKPV
jgi:hypothetical protein